jgi:para-aminobenzoate synthetase component II
MIVLIDNYDSFTFNLVQRFGEIDPDVDIRVFRNDKTTLDELDALSPTHVIISPGPCTPREAGISKAVIRHFAGRVPVLGVCLGHQAMGEEYGGLIVRADRIMHGKTSQIYHDEMGLYAGIPNPFTATRYHSLVIRPDTLPSEFVVSAHTQEGEIMGIRHKTYPMEGVQFHPESFLTDVGHSLLRAFLEQSTAAR